MAKKIKESSMEKSNVNIFDAESLEQLLKLEWAELKESEKDADTVDFARILISGTINHIEEVDEVIKAHLTQNWEFSRVNKVSLAILRISSYSLLFQPEIHPTIVIDEAIDIAREYGADESYKFINAVLDHIRKEKEVED